MPKPTKHIEPNVIDNFSLALRAAYLTRHGTGTVSDHYVGSNLGSQDEELADYLAEVNGRFLLIEFKDNEKAIQTEISKKPLRKKLSAAYQTRADLLDMGKQMHFIGWGMRNPVANEVPQLSQSSTYREFTLFDRYPYKLCKLTNPSFLEEHSKQREEQDFINAFFDSEQVGGRSTRFKRYVEELYKLAGKDTKGELSTMQGNVFIYAPKPGSNIPIIERYSFVGIQHLYDLTVKRDRRLDRENQRDIEDDGPELSL